MMDKYTVSIFFDSPLGFKQYCNATKVEETFTGGLQFTTEEGHNFTISHKIPWAVTLKGEQS